MDTPVEIHCSEVCWRFLHDDVVAALLTAELRAVIIDLSPRVRRALPEPTPRYVVSMLRPHAHELLRALTAALDALRPDDPGRRGC